MARTRNRLGKWIHFLSTTHNGIGYIIERRVNSEGYIFYRRKISFDLRHPCKRYLRWEYYDYGHNESGGV